MKNIIEELNNMNNMPVMQLDDNLKIYSEQNRFAKKRESATALIQRVGLPKQDFAQPQQIENTDNKLLLPEKQIRKVWHDNEWWFSINDFIRFLTDSKTPSRYWSNLKKGNECLLRIPRKFKLLSNDNKYYLTDCATIEGTLRILMDIPSYRAENAARWLYETNKKPSYEENPQLHFEHQQELEKAKVKLMNG